ncbi:MAG: hypothetical protein QM655_08060 [Nocardioidaceae bacterium]
MNGLQLAVVAAGLSQPSSTRLLADRLADAVIAVTPVFTASYAGLFTPFEQLLDQD